MMYVDLDDIAEALRHRWFWSARRPNIAWFRRRDHLGPPDQPLDQSVRDLVASRTGRRPSGPIRLLTHFRYFGYVMNPISLYYCFNANQGLEFVVAEVTNTPWGERHCYVLEARADEGKVVRATASKDMHVSPFLGMEYDYRFKLTPPGSSLKVHIENRTRNGDSYRSDFAACLSMQRRPLSGYHLARVLCRYPMITGQVGAGIYWQALRLWRKGATYFPNPGTQHPQNAKPSHDRAFEEQKHLFPRKADANLQKVEKR